MTFNDNKTGLRKISRMTPPQTTDNNNTVPFPLTPIPLLFIALCYLLTACNNSFNGHVQLMQENKAAGNIVITLGGNARTLLPSRFDASKLYFVLNFKSGVTGEEREETLDRKNSITVLLYEGAWDIAVRGYASETEAKADEGSQDAANALVFGGQEITVQAEGITTVHIELNPNENKLTQSGTGTLCYSISIPQGAEGTFSVHTVDPQLEYPIEPVEFTELSPNGICAAGELLLPSGFYYVIASAQYNDNVKVWRELAHVYDNAITEAVHEFKEEDFPITPVGAIGQIRFPALPDEYVYSYREAETDLNIIVQPGTDLSALVPAISFSGILIDPAPGSVIDFTQAQDFTIYAENGIMAKYSVTVKDTIDSTGLLADYLNHCSGNTVNNPVKVKVDVNLANVWQSLFTALASAGRYVDLDLSGSFGLETFLTINNTGKDRIVNLVLPDSITDIADNAFSGYTRLKSVTVKSGHAAFSSVDGILYSANMSELIAFPPAKTASAFTVPASVTSIANSAFLGCAGLSEIIMHPGVAVIGNSAFQDCANLTTVSILGKIAAGSFSPNALFPGNLRDVYIAAGGGIGTYSRPSASSSEWVNHGIIFTVTNAGEWDNALLQIRTINEDGRTYTVDVIPSADFGVSGTAANSFGAKTGLKITVNGNSRKLVLINNGSILRLAAGQNLFLNGLILGGKASNDQPVLYIGGGTCTMNGGSISGNQSSGTDGGGVLVFNGGTFTLLNGTIFENKAGYGGGVSVVGSNFIMQGSASVYNNNCNNTGGGVQIWEGTFTMEGGTISGNKAPSNGGGVFVNGIFTMSGGSINNNEANGNGGGVEVNTGRTFTMLSGTVSENKASYGGGVHVNNGSFTMQGSALVKGNTSTQTGGGVRIINGGTFTMQGGEISGNSALSTSSDESGGGVLVMLGSTFKMTNGKIGVNGSPNKSYSGAGVFIKDQNTNFTMEGGTVGYNEAKHEGGGVRIYGTGPVFNMKGGEISSNKVTRTDGGSGNGGGVNVGGSFTMSGGDIKNNEANDGGGVYVNSGRTFTMSGGSISGNKNAHDGGGVFISGGTFNMTGGSIFSNTTGSGGGGVFIAGGTFNMKDAVINNNTGNAYGGGIYNNGGSFIMEGTAKVHTNNASITGGGVVITGNGTLDMKSNNSLIYGNKTATGGGVYLDGTLHISGGIITGNKESISHNGTALAYNTAPDNKAALFLANGRAQYGTFSGNNFNPNTSRTGSTTASNLCTTSENIKVENGNLTFVGSNPGLYPGPGTGNFKSYRENVEYRITDSGQLNQPYDKIFFSDFGININEKRLINGYNKISFKIRLNIREYDDGYQWIMLYPDDGYQWIILNPLVISGEYWRIEERQLWEHGTSYDGSWWDHNEDQAYFDNKPIIDIFTTYSTYPPYTPITIDRSFYDYFVIRYGASGSGNDDWGNKNLRIRLEFYR